MEVEVLEERGCNDAVSPSPLPRGRAQPQLPEEWSADGSQLHPSAECCPWAKGVASPESAWEVTLFPQEGTPPQKANV